MNHKINSSKTWKTIAAAALIGMSPALFAESPMNNHDGNRKQTENQSRRQDNQRSYADNSDRERRNSTPDRGQSVRPLPEDPRGWYASDLKGREVFGSEGEKLGELDDFAVDPRSGKIEYVIVSSGGVLGVGSTLRAVPVQAIQHGKAAGTERRFTLEVNENRWKQAPIISKAPLAVLGDDRRREDIAGFYGDSPAGDARRENANKDEKSIRAGVQLRLASELVGQEVRNGKQSLGTIDDMIVQLDNKSAAALLDPADALADADRRYIVPLNRLTWRNEDALNTTLTSRNFTSATTTKDSSWGSEPAGYVNSVYIWTVYSAMTTDGARSDERQAQTRVQSRDEDQGNRDAREVPVATIRRAVQDVDGSGDVRVSTSGDTVVLSGTVFTEKVKDRIEERAERAGSGRDIDNRIRVVRQDS